jgi:hypothetical protein
VVRARNHIVLLTYRRENIEKYVGKTPDHYGHMDFGC